MLFGQDPDSNSWQFLDGGYGSEPCAGNDGTDALKSGWVTSYVYTRIPRTAVIFLDWVSSGALWRSGLWIGVDPINLIGWMEWI